MTIPAYLAEVNRLFQSGIAREHAYRPDFQNLIKALLPDLHITNEPARVACGAPDYVVTRKELPVGYIEAKDVGVDLESKSLKEQFDRYKAGLTNLIFTDYLDFHFYKDGQLTTKIRIARIDNSNGKPQIVPMAENFDHFTELIRNFAQTVTQTIKSPTKLAQMMAGKAKLMADVIEKSLDHDDNMVSRTPLRAQMIAFQQMLIHDIDNKAFSDIYAQTIAYGMFAARYHDPTLPTFSRMEAAELIPKSNPFLRKLFQDIAGYDLDDRLVWIVDELVSIFLASDVATIMRNFGKSTKQEDPVVHFYETFLAEYNPALRKARGVWYTPQPVVNFIVRAVDDILKDEFGLPQGLADTSKIKIKRKAVTQTGTGPKSKIKEVEQEVEVHKVQILDPATGTGTFLAETVRHIHKKFEGQQGLWSQYVTKDLIPRLNGFELLMASYAMAHLKMDMLLTETGYKPDGDQRFRIFLTNSLEEAHPDTTTLFSSWLSDEADQANAVKRDTPVMVVIGNPPYSVSSTNKSPWILDLIKDYKKNLNERKINLDDDYIKFIRYGQHYIDKNGEGILAYISNNSFIDGITHRQMRKSLLESFDKIYIIDLHGSAKKNEIAPDGTKDENVFDIQQGVSINIFVKAKGSNSIIDKRVFHYDLFGSRLKKYDLLNANSISSINFTSTEPSKPYHFFQPKDFSQSEVYNQGFSTSELFINQNSGIQTKADDIAVQFSLAEITEVVESFQNNSPEELKKQFSFKKESSGWNFKSAKNSLNDYFEVIRLNYRIFDDRFSVFTKLSGGFIGRPRIETMRHFVGKDNYGLVLCRQQSSFDFQHVFITRFCTDLNSVSLQTKEQSYEFPLYVYPKESSQLLMAEQSRTPNLNPTILQKIATGMHMHFAPEPPPEGATVEANTFFPIDLLDYIYAVLHSPSYREKYKEFLKIDFPRVPYPESEKEFRALAEIGAQLREIHLLESPVVERYITQFPEAGSMVVEKPVYQNGHVYINPQQYFAHVPEAAWNFYIGGYQPAQKWLKDRKGRTLSIEDVLHYQKIVVALSETKRLMGEIDGVKQF